MKSGGLVLNDRSKNKAIWVNTNGSDFNPGREKYKVIIEIGDNATSILNNHTDISDVDWKETGLKNGVLSKTNEPGARGIGTGVLKEINQDIKNMEILTKQSGKPWRRISKIC